ncbi:hypothetical protein ScPMuIL_013916 [Solemya velum]
MVCVNVSVGIAQMFTLTFFLVGWFWGIAWGIRMVVLSVEHRKEMKVRRERELQALTLRAFGSPLQRTGGGGLSIFSKK